MVWNFITIYNISDVIKNDDNYNEMKNKQTKKIN